MTGEWILFPDAALRLPPGAVEAAVAAAGERGLDVLSPWFQPAAAAIPNRLHHRLSAACFRLARRLRWRHSMGACLLVRAELHGRLGGFDTALRVAKDRDGVVRAACLGRHDFLRRPVVEIPVRRFRDEGFLAMSAKWLGIEPHRVTLGEIRHDRVRYFSK